MGTWLLKRLWGGRMTKGPLMKRAVVLLLFLVPFLVSSHKRYEPYKRSLYPHWIDADWDCQNTRAEVLIRDDDDQVVQFKTANRCRVVAGTWHDPYSGLTFNDASKIDVDHVVPLKNAHESGAWAWDRSTRRAYANYLGYRNHLLAVSARENRRKGAKGPDQYLPPNQAFRCEYVHSWLEIKKRWQLGVPSAEMAAIKQVLASCP